MSNLSLPEPLQTPDPKLLWTPGSRPLDRPPGISRAGLSRRRCCCDGDTIPCSVCIDDAPCCYKVVLAGLTDGSCWQCACLNGTYYLQYDTECFYTTELACRVIGSPGASYCGVGSIELEISYTDPDYFMTVSMGGRVTWIENLGPAKLDCKNFVNQNVSYDSHTATCNGPSATCTVSSVSRSSCEFPDTHCPQIEAIQANRLVLGCCECFDTPQQYEVVIQGIVNDSCTDCDDLNGTFIVDIGETVSAGSGCGGAIKRWVYVSPAAKCFGFELWLNIDCRAGLERLTVIWSGAIPPTALWLLDMGPPPYDCQGLLGQDIPFFSTGTRCDASGSTCTVTAL